MRVCLHNCTQHFIHFFTGHYRIKHIAVFSLIAAYSLEQRRIVIGNFPDPAVNHIGLLRNNQKGVLLVTLVQHLYYLRRAELEYNRIQCPVKTEQNPRNHKNAHISQKDIIPGINASLL